LTGRRPHRVGRLTGFETRSKTVAWDVFFRVNQPHRPYYLDTYGTSKRVPGRRYYTPWPGGNVSRKKRAEPLTQSEKPNARAKTTTTATETKKQ
jgi:hypothetical protein